MIFAHRGAAHLLPENTLPAFRRAIQLGANGLEFDVHLTKDGHPVVIHDEKVNRTTNGRGLVKRFTLKELQQLSAGAWFHPRYSHIKIPTLEDILKKVVHFPTLLNIEMKNTLIRYDGIEQTIIKLIQKYQLQQQVILSSFNPKSIKKIASLDDQIIGGFLYFGKLDEPWRMASELGARVIHPPINAISRDFVTQSHEHGLLVCPYHVNHWRQINLALDCRVDGLITQHPERVRKFVE
ncbi:hypothetical protein BEP19_06340 [Ammoniphilus oxalaticus]|uniref:GP-PDE domain-containing protein n=2 Tax=Ammoniphilus oxalaticus TaxID=66863 RepID=A0A419SKZ0_9BACL|nr:hypothetical protein BEP19_06340 [Ammoniphilus oxalaticus]